MAITSRWSVVIAVLLLFLLGVSWIAASAQLARDQAVPLRAKAAGYPMPVRTATVVQQALKSTIGATAVTEPARTASIWVGPGIGLRDARVRIRSVHVTEGQFVREGELLFELEDGLFIQAVRRHQLALAAAEAELASVHQLRREQAATGLQLRQAELNVELTRFELLVAENDLQRCQVRSPLNGTVDEVTAVLGEEVDVSREFTQIHCLNPIHVRVDFPQERLEDVFIGQSATVVLDSFPQEILEACVAHISPQADPETRTLPVILALRNDDQRIRAGLTGFARLDVDRTVAALPATAVTRRGTKSIVFLIEEGRAVIREVEVGPSVGIGNIEIRSGLQVGDVVVVHGNEYLQNDDLVNVDWQNWARRK